MKVFITGGTGFIGKYVMQKLIEEDYDISILCIEERLKKDFKNDNEIHLIKGDLSEIKEWEEKLKTFEPDVCIHLAWEGIPDYSYKYSVKNLIMSLNLFNVLADIKCKKIICSGSCWEYNRKKGKLDENMTITPQNPFLAAKHSIHTLGQELARENNMDFIWTRLFYVYGPGQKNHSLIPHIIKTVSSGKKPEIKTPYSKNDFVYVEDVARAFLMILKKSKGIDTYNIGSGYSTQIKDIIDMIYLNCNFNKKFITKINKPSNSDIVNFYADISKIKNEIGWEPETSIEEGVEKTVKSMVDKFDR